MNLRILKFLLRQEGLWVRFGLGIGLVAAKVVPWLGWLAIAAGIHKAWKLVSDTPDLEERLELQDLKRRHSLKRELTELEQKKLIEILRYLRLFEERGGDSLVAKSLVDHALRSVCQGPAGKELEALHASLPPLGRGHQLDRSSVLEMLDREAAIIRASELEMLRFSEAT